MSEKRKIILDGDINLKTAARIFKKLFKLQEIPTAPIIFEITESRGGNIILSIMLYQLLKHSVANVTTVVRKKAQSGAFFLFQGGKVRKICKNAKLQFHWTEAKVTENFTMDFSALTDILSYVEKCNEQLYGIVIESSGMDLKKVIEFCKQEKCLSAREALRLNLADQIIEDY